MICTTNSPDVHMLLGRGPECLSGLFWTDCDGRGSFSRVAAIRDCSGALMESVKVGVEVSKLATNAKFQHSISKITPARQKRHAM